jgi:hypothetical protein
MEHPRPDDKNWTWVLERPCPACRFDAGIIARHVIGATLRTTVEAWREVLRRDFDVLALAVDLVRAADSLELRAGDGALPALLLGRPVDDPSGLPIRLGRGIRRAVAVRGLRDGLLGHLDVSGVAAATPSRRANGVNNVPPRRIQP